MLFSRRLGIALLAASTVAAAMVYSLRRASIAAQNEIVPELVLLAPGDAQSLFYADLVALRASPFLSRIESLGGRTVVDPDYAEFVRLTGFDYSRDLDRILVAVVPQSPARRSVAFAEGRFDRERIAAYAQRVGRIEQHAGREVYVFPARAPGKTISLAFLDAHRVVLGQGPSLEFAFSDRARGLDRAMLERIRRVAGAAFFAAGRVEPVPANFAPGGVRSDQFANLARSLRWFTLAARPEGEQMQVALEGECDTPENAQQLAGTLEGLRLLGQTALADPRTRQRVAPQVLGALELLLSKAQLSREEQRVSLRVELTPEMLDAARRTVPEAKRPIQ